MKRNILLLALLFSACIVEAQYKRLVRIYEDNDLINIYGKVTDKAYSNGTRADFFYQPNKELKFFIYRLFPKAGVNSNTTLGWSIMQVMITPDQIARTEPDPNDFRYAGSLLLTHTLHSANDKQRLNIQSQWVVGVMGPPSMAKETQIWIHKVTGNLPPRGWNHQLPTDLLLNYNLTVEKGLFNYLNAIEFVLAGQALAGSMLQGAALSGTLRIGKLPPYFSNYIQRYVSDKKLRWYAFVKPSLEVTLYNALLEGGLFNKKDAHQKLSDNGPHPEVQRLVGCFDFGFGTSLKKVSFAFTQKTLSSLIKGQPKHMVGNISITYSW
ncbi:MAG TPA: lipid A deacylase LpxR family protein [Flavisolibacter sp.]|nr:lipid A deacylase LpxR family protein [Flavisolibacter sp.]